MSRIELEDVVKFADVLEVRARERFPSAKVELKKLINSGHYVVLIHSDSTLQCETDCYMIDPISREWIKTYGTL